ncbi:DNA-binding response regulator [Roseisolibacter sp. H3M3-2]|uniref:response regulator transcription factor n=1 Tax=Roseisolibacter sp. H3M3-2 TaxID=3031323 RepID=UPI0023DC96CD|nr:DNA-binding response regulator [Roseisolibacter sp. H3M3-2]MDF1505902.1 DNA-binding response regulator [Roseisolibacter sp. H3M3-2]
MNGIPLPRARVLVVEDHDDLAEALEVNLRRDGHEVLRARDGRDALYLARGRDVDLVILDLGLPRVDGLGVLERLRAEGHWSPVLILSARSTPDDKVAGFRLGADDYVTKPFHTEELLSRVRALLRRPPARPDGDEPPAPPPAPPAAVGYTDDELVARFGLTLRQAAVARLLAEGLSNPEIAAALSISRFTARNHAEQVLVKVGVPSRGRVAAALRAAYEAERATP